MFNARLRTLLFACSCFGFFSSVLPDFSSADPFSAQELRQGFRNGRLLAKPTASAQSANLDAAESQHGAHLHRVLNASGKLRMLDLPPHADLRDAARQLRASGLYQYVEPDYIRHPHAVPNDPLFTQQWNLKNTGQNGGTIGADIGADAAWDLQSTAPQVIVAVIDSGLRPTHEDLASVLWQNPHEIAGNNVDDDHNNYVDDVNGINTLATQASGQGDISDNEGHGTAVSSIIAAAGNNGKGISGVVWATKLMSCKFNDATEGSTVSNEIACLQYAVANGAKIINISYGSPSYSQSEYDALKAARDAGVIIVVSAGNDGASNDTAVEYPASYALENVLSVANSDRTDNLDPSSTYGGLVELAAPGTEITTCTNASDSSYGVGTGTSFSAPHVSGALALLAAKFPSDTYRKLINRVLNSVDPLSSLSGKVTTSGRLNLSNALSSTNTRPFNDDFAHAATLVGTSINTRAASLGATAEASEPVHGAAGGASLWWSWTAPSSGNAVVDTAGSSFDTTAAVYTGSTLNQLTQLASNDNFNSAVTSRVTFPTVAGTIYHIAVDGKNGVSGMVALSVGLVPANDTFSNAIALSGESAKTIGNNANASKQIGEPTLSAEGETGQGKTVWYMWTAPATAAYSFSAFTSSLSPIIGVFTGSSVTALSEVAEDTDAVYFNATAGKVYHIAVDSTSGSSGGFTLTFLKGQAVPLSDAVTPSPALTPDGSLVLADGGSAVFYYKNQNNYFATHVGGLLDVNTPAAPNNTTFYVSTTTGLYAETTSNTVAWSKNYSGVASSPSVAADGTIYIHSDDGVLHALTSTGSEKWTAAVPGISYSSPTIAYDGTVYQGSDDNHLYAVNPTDGGIKWTFDAGGQIYGSPALGSDGTIYFGTLSSQFFAVSPNGVQRWVFTAGGEISSSAAIGVDGTLYFGAYDGKLYALNPSGALKWTFTTGDQIRASSPAIAADGTIYIGSYDGNLYGVSATGAQTMTYATGAEIRSSPLIDNTQGLLFGSGDHRAYLVDLGGTGPANSPWPMFRQNAQRTGRATSSSAPSITFQPSSTSVAIGGNVTLSVGAQGSGSLTYQWSFNGVAIAGATQSTYTINSTTTANAGSYTVAITNSLGTTTSSAATLAVVPADELGRLVNLSARAAIGDGDQVLIVGLVVQSGSENLPLLIRGVGPSLQASGVPDAIDDPKLTVFQGQTAIASNDDWNGDAQVSATTAQLHATALGNTKDAALVTGLAGGSFTAEIAGGATSATGTGVALAEFYDASTTITVNSSRLINISARAQVGQSDNVLIVGFVVSGTTPVKVLIRGLGPELTKHGLTAAEILADPTMTLRPIGSNDAIQTNDNWIDAPNLAEVQDVMARLTNNDLDTSSKDSVILTTLQPGAYTAVVSGVNNSTGIALAEIYEVR